MRRVQDKVQIHRQTSRWLRTKPRLRVWNEQYDRRRKVKIDLRRFGFILCVLLGWIFVRIKKKKKRKGERKTKRALFFLLWNVASSSSCLLDCTRALLIILSIATTHTAHILSTVFPSLARDAFSRRTTTKDVVQTSQKIGERDIDDGNNNNNNTNSSARTRYSCDLLIIITTIFFPFSLRTTRRFVVIHICR